jgi:hypothetical protein
MAEFDWWLLILGLVVGGGLVYLVLAEARRRDVDEDEVELPAEATWIAGRLADRGVRMKPDLILEVLHEHRAYLEQPPPDAIVGPPEAEARPDA